MSEETSSFNKQRQQSVLFVFLVAFIAYMVISYLFPYVLIWQRNARERNETMARIEAKQKRCELFASQENLETNSKKVKQPQSGAGIRRFDLKCKDERIKDNTEEVPGEGKSAKKTTPPKTTTSTTTTKSNEKFTLKNGDSGPTSAVNVTGCGCNSSSSCSSSQRRDVATLWREVCHFHPYYYASGSNPWMTRPSTAVSSTLEVALGRERSLRLSQDMEYAAAIAADLQRQETIVAALRHEQEQETKQQMKAETWQQLVADEPPEGEDVITIKFQYKLEGHNTAEHPLLTARINRRFLPTDPSSKVLSTHIYNLPSQPTFTTIFSTHLLNASNPPYPSHVSTPRLLQRYSRSWNPTHCVP